MGEFLSAGILCQHSSFADGVLFKTQEVHTYLLGHMYIPDGVDWLRMRHSLPTVNKFKDT